MSDKLNVSVNFKGLRICFNQNVALHIIVGTLHATFLYISLSFSKQESYVISIISWGWGRMHQFDHHLHLKGLLHPTQQWNMIHEGTTTILTFTGVPYSFICCPSYTNPNAPNSMMFSIHFKKYAVDIPVFFFSNITSLAILCG